MPRACAATAKSFATPEPLIQYVTKAAKNVGGALHDCLPDGRKPGTAALEPVSVTKVPGVEMAVTAPDDVFRVVGGNEFFTPLGPSGCGKTTLLRLMAEFEQITEGEIPLFGDDVLGLPPYRQPINTVFRHDALFPHMTVVENVAFFLNMLRRSASETRCVVNETPARALTTNDGTAVLQAGRTQQVGTPDEIYERPVNTVVADFMGETNLLETPPVEAADDPVRCRLEGGAEFLVTPAPGACAQGPVTLSVRPERIIYRGADLVYRVEFEEGPALVGQC